MAVLQLVQEGQVTLSDTVGTHLDGLHGPGGGAGIAMAAQIVEAVTGTTFRDHVHEHVFGYGRGDGG